jgi:hypothetical protein
MKALTLLLVGLMTVVAFAEEPIKLAPLQSYRMYNCPSPANIGFILMDNTVTPDQIKYIMLKPGEYEIDKPIILDQSNVWLHGKGVKLKLKDKANCPVIIVGTDRDTSVKKVSNVRVLGFDIDGNRENQTQELNEANNELRNNCITVRGAENVIIRDVGVRNARSGGIVTEKHSKNVLIDDVVAEFNHFDGIAMYETTESIVQNSTMQKNEYAGLSMDWKADNNRFIRCQFRENGHQGIFMRFCSKNIFAECLIKLNRRAGAYMAQVDDVTGTHCEDIYFFFCEFNANRPNIEVNNDSCIRIGVIASYFMKFQWF